jgi:hypothetical protein
MIFSPRIVALFFKASSELFWNKGHGVKLFPENSASVLRQQIYRKLKVFAISLQLGKSKKHRHVERQMKIVPLLFKSPFPMMRRSLRRLGSFFPPVDFLRSKGQFQHHLSSIEAFDHKAFF